jgi:hypothetical protein
MKVFKVFEDPFPKDRWFLAIWEAAGSIDGIELYHYDDGNRFYNHNSGNMNELGGKGQVDMFTRWAEVPKLED